MYGPPGCGKTFIAKAIAGDLGASFIIAVGTYIHDRDRWHSGNAMYGHVAVQIGEAPDGSMSSAKAIRQSRARGAEKES